MSPWIILSRWLSNWAYSHTHPMSCRDVQPQLECWFLVELHSMHSRVLLPTGGAGWCNRLLLWGILLSKWHHCWASVSLSTWNIWRQSWPYSARWMFNLPTGENLWLGHWYKQQQYLDWLPSWSLLSSRWVVCKWWVTQRKPHVTLWETAILPFQFVVHLLVNHY